MGNKLEMGFIKTVLNFFQGKIIKNVFRNFYLNKTFEFNIVNTL